MFKAYIDGLKKWKRWDGRTRRRDYWLYSLCDLIVSSSVLGIALLSTGFGSPTVTVFAWIICVGYYVLSFLPTLAITIRRLHDTGRGFSHLFVKYLPTVVSGLLAAVGLGGIITDVVSAVCSVIFIVWMASAGTKGRNKYGPDPKDTFEADVNSVYGEYPDFRGE